MNKLLDDIRGGRIEGKKFSNDGRDGSEILPTHGKGGKVTYKEFDVNEPPTQAARDRGATRDKKRIVVGSDGSAYYTSTHYKKFTKITN